MSNAVEYPDGQPPSWQQLIEARGPERTSLSRDAAFYVWSWMRSQAEHSTMEFTPVTLGTRDGVPVLAEKGGIPGFRWDGVFRTVFQAIWNLPRETADGEPGGMRHLISWQLKATGNIICVDKGATRAANPRPPTWFIRDTWNNAVPARPVTSLMLPSLGTPQPAKAEPKTLRKPPPHRELPPAPYQCRITSCRRVFTTVYSRDTHERRFHPDKVSDVVDGGYVCGCGAGPFKNKKGLGIHSRICKETEQAQFVHGSKAASAEPVPAPEPVLPPAPVHAAEPVLTKETSLLSAISDLLRDSAIGTPSHEVTAIMELNKKLRSAIAEAASILTAALETDEPAT